MSRIFLAGYAHVVGGAGPESLHSLALWRQAGITPTLVPTWGTLGIDPRVRRKMDALGYKTLDVPNECPGGIKAIPGIEGATVVSFCNEMVLVQDTWKTFKRLGCRTIWVPTMTWASPVSAKVFALDGLPDVIVYQSEFQRSAYEKSLCDQNAEGASKFIPEDVHRRGRLIRGAFDVSEWPFQPREHKRPDPFVIGKLAGARPEKWNPDLWKIYDRVPYQARMAFVMGVNRTIDPRTKRPFIDFSTPKPDWAEWALPDSMPVQKYLGKIHCLVPANAATTPENAPVVTREAYATGVSVVAPNNSGWREQVIDGETGFLCSDDDETAFKTAELIYYPEKRMRMLQRAREYLVDDLCDPGPILEKWLGVFGELA